MNLILESKMLNFITMKNLIKITPKINKTNNNLIIIMIFFKIKMIFFKIKMIFLVMKAKIIKMKMLKILKKDFLNKVQYLIIIRKDFHNKALFRIIKITTNPYKKKKPKQQTSLKIKKEKLQIKLTKIANNCKKKVMQHPIIPVKQKIEITFLIKMIFFNLRIIITIISLIKKVVFSNNNTKTNGFPKAHYRNNRKKTKKRVNKGFHNKAYIQKTINNSKYKQEKVKQQTKRMIFNLIMIKTNK